MKDKQATRKEKSKRNVQVTEQAMAILDRLKSKRMLTKGTFVSRLVVWWESLDIAAREAFLDMDRDPTEELRKLFSDKDK